MKILKKTKRKTTPVIREDKKHLFFDPDLTEMIKGVYDCLFHTTTQLKIIYRLADFKEINLEISNAEKARLIGIDAMAHKTYEDFLRLQIKPSIEMKKITDTNKKLIDAIRFLLSCSSKDLEKAQKNAFKAMIEAEGK